MKSALYPGVSWALFLAGQYIRLATQRWATNWEQRNASDLSL